MCYLMQKSKMFISFILEKLREHNTEDSLWRCLQKKEYYLLDHHNNK